MIHPKVKGIQFDIQELVRAVEDVLFVCDWHKNSNQIGLTCMPGSTNPFYEGTGSTEHCLLPKEDVPIGVDVEYERILISDYLKNKDAFRKKYKGWDLSGLPEEPLKETKFTEFVKGFKHTYFYEVYNIISKQFSVGRVRLMKLPPKSCLTWHHDWNKRVHVPIVTHPNCIMITGTPLDQPLAMSDVTVSHMEADGSAYLFNTDGEHTAINASVVNRIHLVFNLI